MPACNDALVKAARDARARGLKRTRGADVGGAGEPPLPLLAHGPVRVAIFAAAILTPWVVIALVVRALLNHSA